MGRNRGQRAASLGWRTVLPGFPPGGSVLRISRNTEAGSDSAAATRRVARGRWTHLDVFDGIEEALEDGCGLPPWIGAALIPLGFALCFSLIFRAGGRVGRNAAPVRADG